MPPVVLVGTHLDQVQRTTDKDDAEEFLSSVSAQLWDALRKDVAFGSNNDKQAPPYVNYSYS